MKSMVGISLLFLTTVALSQEYDMREGVRQHDGFFLRILPGGGSSEFSMTAPDDMLLPQNRGKDMVSYSGGFTVANTLQIGGAVTENLIIFGESGGVFSVSPTVKNYDREVTSPGSAWVYSGGFGPGISYYFMPANIYISGSALANIAVMALHGSTEGSKIGLGLHFLVGKEWWTGEQWGLGLAGYYRYASQKNDNVDFVTMSGSSFGLVFSATLN